jgi:lipid-binding SYLF domain-containing protein
MNDSSSAIRAVLAVLALGGGLVSLAPTLGACAREAKSAAELQHVNLEQQERLQASAQLVTGLRSHIPDEVARRARCIVVVPASEKGRIVLGGEGGKGFATCLAGGAWSSPAPIDVSVRSGFVGARIGHESADVVAILVTEEAAKTLERGKLEFGVAGRTDTGATTEDFAAKGGVLTYAHSKGRFALVRLDGLTMSSDVAATRLMYGEVDLAAVVERRATPPRSASVQSFLATVDQAFAPSDSVTPAPPPSQ